MPDPQTKRESTNQVKPVPVAVPVDLYPWLKKADVKGNGIEHVYFTIVKDAVQSFERDW